MKTRSSCPPTYLVAKTITCYHVLHCYKKRGRRQYRPISSALQSHSTTIYNFTHYSFWDADLFFYSAHSARDAIERIVNEFAKRWNDIGNKSPQLKTFCQNIYCYFEHKMVQKCYFILCKWPFWPTNELFWNLVLSNLCWRDH